MGDRTPKRCTNSSINGFSPIILPESPAVGSPQKNLTGTPRVARDLVADLYNTIQRWNDLHISGVKIVKQIASLKADNPKSFAPPLDELCVDLYNLIGRFHGYKTLLVSYCNQIEALAKLQSDSKPLFISLDLMTLARIFKDIIQTYCDEYEVKQFVLENVAHAKNKDQAMFFAALWTYQYKISNNIEFKLETLLIETGHRKFN